MSKTSQDDWRMTDEKLKKRLLKVERGSICKQSLMVFAVSLGSFSFGNIMACGEPAQKHIPELISDPSEFDEHFAWLLFMSPLVAGLSLLVWAFIKERIGPKNTILLQTPPLLVGWALKGYLNTMYYYTAGHIVTAFFSISYIYAGSTLVTECVHRNNIKIYYTIFRSASMLGVLCMAIISTSVERFLMCHICASFSVVTFIMLCFLPDSPVYYMKKGRITQAENSLKFYMGNQPIVNETNVIRQYVFLLGTGQSYQHMFSKKVVLKALVILFFLQVFRTMSGFYALVLNSVVIFQKGHCVLNPYYDNIIYGSVLFISRLIFCYVILKERHKIGVKILLLMSSIFMAMVLFTLAFFLYYQVELGKKWMTQVVLCGVGVAYHIGLDIIPDILTYEYLPYQIYSFMVKVMHITHWLLVACVVRIYLWLQKDFDTYVALFTLASVTTIGVFFIATCIVETKGKSLTNIQMELGANPVGSRGSQRQRIGNPFEIDEGANYLINLIAEHANDHLGIQQKRRSKKSVEQQKNSRDLSENKNQSFSETKT